ncbi:MAG: alpha/beta fold hydrolase [Chloroflexi bacterium]|nr:alpha/beta fold hydrolase [Chloroflexota bacterium]
MVEFATNGKTGSGYLALPDSGSGPGVIVLQEWWGLVDHIKDVADRFAREGFVALAPDMYHGQTTTSPDDAGKLMMALNIDVTAKDMSGAIDFVLARDECTGDKVGTVGFCMGGQLALMYGGVFPEAPLKNLACVATPVDSEEMGLLHRLADPRWFDVDRIVDTLGNIPPDLILRSFELLRPAQRWATYARLTDNLWNELWVKNYRLFNRWVNDQIPFPGEAYRQMIKELMWENKLMKGEFDLSGRRVDLAAIACPVLHVMAEHDDIAPIDATRPLTSLVGSEDKEDVLLKGGHVSLVAGRNAWFRLWPKISEWLGARSV